MAAKSVRLGVAHPHDDALREIAEGKVLPADPRLDRPETAGAPADSSVEGK